MSLDKIISARDIALQHVISIVENNGQWRSKLSSSALSTAVAVIAMVQVDADKYESHIINAANWLISSRNADNGWGDTPDSPGNISTTLLAASALKLAASNVPEIARIAGDIDYTCGISGGSEGIVRAVTAKYGEDRTFAVPILAVCALAGLVEWKQVPNLPFELSLFPGSLYRILNLQVVSYALPALIAVGLLIAVKSGRFGPLRRILLPALLGKLRHLQPESGGYLEAAPLTGFVAASLAACGLSDSEVTNNCMKFLTDTVREDGSWPIDTDLNIWVTINAISALQSCGHSVPESERWVASQQYQRIHPFTGAKPGAWGWSERSGAVPDADDTSGALRVLSKTRWHEQAKKGVQWLLDLQNRDGGWPTFCRGWGKLPFDRSSPDITAHALRAISSCANNTSNKAIANAAKRGLKFLQNSQREDGSWVPLWFGCQQEKNQQNPVFGTGRVLQALADAGNTDLAQNGVKYLIDAQNKDGGWGGARHCNSTVEETAVAVMGLAGHIGNSETQQALQRGMDYLADRVLDATWVKPAPLGLYFASLWYSEELYPLVWTLEALSSGLSAIGSDTPGI